VAQGQKLPATQYVPVTVLITAVIYGGSSLVTSRCCASAPCRSRRAAGGRAAGLAAPLGQTWREARAFRDFSWLLACGFAYQPASPWSSRWPRSMPSRCWLQADRDHDAIFLVNIAAASAPSPSATGRTASAQAALTSRCWLGADDGAVLPGHQRALFWVAAVIAGCAWARASRRAGRCRPLRATEALAEFYSLWTLPPAWPRSSAR